MAEVQLWNLSEVYDALVDWPKRLANETPFYRDWFAAVGAKRVLDAACGTGRHAGLFHSWGLEVQGADLSAEMIAQARAGMGEGERLQWVVRGFGDPAAPAGVFDAVVCVGNSLALAGADEEIARGIGRMLAALRPGGLLIVQVLNLWQFADGALVWQRCRRAKLSGGEAVILKGVRRHGQQAYVELVLMEPGGEKLLYCESVPFAGVEAAVLRDSARQAGAREVLFFGGYQQQPYRRSESGDLIMTARRG